MLYSSAARGKVVMCDSPVCGHRFRSCHTIYFILSMDDIGYWTIPSFVEPLLITNLAWRALSWCRRTSVRPPDDIEKSIAHRLHCAMPLSGNFAIQTPPILACIFSSAPFFFNGDSDISYPENMENSAASEERWRLSNEDPSPMARHGSSIALVAVLMLPAA